MSWWLSFEQMVIFSVSVSVSKLNLDAGGNGEECLRRPSWVSASGTPLGGPLLFTGRDLRKVQFLIPV